MKKFLPLLSLALLAIFPCQSLNAAMNILEWRPWDAKKDDKGGITVPDRTGNGYEITYPSGIAIESDPSALGGKALFFDGTFLKGSRPSIPLMELPDANITLKIKPGTESTSVSEIFNFGGRWMLRYNADRHSFQLNVSTNASASPSPRLFLEGKAQVGEWNHIVVIINPTRIELRINGQATFFAGEMPETKLAPIPNGPVTMLRTEGLSTGKFVGSIGEMTVTMSTPTPSNK